MALKANLQADLAGEKKAIVTYGQRRQQAAGTPMAPILKEIQGDEQDHKKRLSTILQGLKQAGPN